MDKLYIKIALLEEQLRNAMRVEYENSANIRMKEQSWSLYNKSVRDLMALAQGISDTALMDGLVVKKLEQEIRCCEHTIDVILKSKFIDTMDKQDLLNNLKNIEALNHIIKYLE